MNVLQVDERPYYGAEQASLSLVELDDWSRSVDRTRYSNVELKYRDGDAWSTSLPQHLRASSRKYSLSLCPVLVPAVCPFVRTLIASGVAKYTNFNLLEGVAMYSDGTFQPAALSKADIFNDKELSLIDKRKLMKFLAFATGDYSRSPLMEGM
ncbi:Rab proteins geranylgeranyltransferase component A [Cystobasidiomycetes sp. EMM_F5]